MKILLHIEDDLFDLYTEEANARHLKIGEVLRERLQKAVALDPRERALVVAGALPMRKLEDVLGGGTLKDTQDLVAKVERLARIKFGDHEFKITPGQYQELAHRATKTGRTIPQLIEEIYRRVSDDFFRYTP